MLTGVTITLHQSSARCRAVARVLLTAQLRVSHLRNLHRQQRCLGSCWRRSTAGPPRPRGQNLHLPAFQGPGRLPSTERGRPAGSGSLTLLSGFMGIVYGTNPLMVNICFLLKTCIRHYSTVPQQIFLCVWECFSVLQSYHPTHFLAVCVLSRSSRV